MSSVAAATCNVSQYAHSIATDYAVISCNCGGIGPNIATDLHISYNNVKRSEICLISYCKLICQSVAIRLPIIVTD